MGSKAQSWRAVPSLGNADICLGMPWFLVGKRLRNLKVKELCNSIVVHEKDMIFTMCCLIWNVFFF